MKAFPNPHRTDEVGMTLRDYFAAKAMVALLNDKDTWTMYNGGDITVSILAYQMADAMLKAREQ